MAARGQGEEEGAGLRGTLQYGPWLFKQKLRADLNLLGGWGRAGYRTFTPPNPPSR